MTDAEIIKACKNCLHYEACKGTYYSAKGDEDVLYDFDGEMYANSGCEDFEDKDHITRQQEQIENLKDILYDAEGVNLVNYWHQQCKIAENGCRNFEEENKKLKAEIERLKEYPKCVYEYDGDIVDYCLKSPCANYKTAKEIKFEAYKEFAEACKACFPSLSKVFDIILKEMGCDNA